jgi:hypothetical protein
VNEVLVVADDGIRDRLHVTGEKGSDESTFARQPSVVMRKAGNFSFIDFAPYLPVFTRHEPGTKLPLADFDADGNSGTIEFSGHVVGREEITVPAGKFDTLRVDIQGRRQVAKLGEGGLIATRLEITAWYAVSHGRYVKLVRNSFNQLGSPLDRDTFELVSYRPGTTADTASAIGRQ